MILQIYIEVILKFLNYYLNSFFKQNSKSKFNQAGAWTVGNAFFNIYHIPCLSLPSDSDISELEKEINPMRSGEKKDQTKKVTIKRNPAFPESKNLVRKLKAWFGRRDVIGR